MAETKRKAEGPGKPRPLFFGDRSSLAARIAGNIGSLDFLARFMRASFLRSLASSTCSSFVWNARGLKHLVQNPEGLSAKYSNTFVQIQELARADMPHPKGL